MCGMSRFSGDLSFFLSVCLHDEKVLLIYGMGFPFRLLKDVDVAVLN